MTDDLILLLTRRASGQSLSAEDQDRLEAALAADPELIDLLIEAQAATAGQAKAPAQTWLIWTQRVALSGLFCLLFSLGLFLGGGLVSTGSSAFAAQDPTFAKGLERERSSFGDKRRNAS